ncbi:TetR/AcrR family transcriptional regulator [Paenibacillus alginolyticus]|uniref:TetR/AcrR family transcriptional regulator n=1 Tax=Paenibacillus alginolyticus TaxID=59839 RepID=UPI0004105233|nr:TetR/AcrR family transcriptional regulator [Paenibacillus alginolyticus]MCY9670056.1 TetR/AcrR family transcriptional regulator [Paenibacillus alginolyticus]
MEHVNTSFQMILDTTEELIREKGCRQTTLQDIISKTGLSKGAIYHYVTGKDELLGLVLKARIEQMNAKFHEVVNNPTSQGLENPLQLIATGIAQTSHHEDVTNKIFIYLLSQMDNPKVSDIMKGVYQYTLNTCVQWIEVGQQSGVIPPTVEKVKVAEGMLMFMYGLRVQNTIRQEAGSMNMQDMMQFMFRSLQ